HHRCRWRAGHPARRRNRRRLPDVRRRQRHPEKGLGHGSNQPHAGQPDHLRAGHLCGLPRGMERHSRPAHAADGRHQRHLGHHHRRRDAGGRPYRRRAGARHGRVRGGAGRRQRVRRLPGHAPHARNVQEKRQEARAGGSPMISLNLVTLLYLVASVCFIQALKGLSHPTTSRLGNAFGMAGMAIAVLTTAALIVQLARAGQAGIGLGWVVLGLLVGGSIGTLMAKRVEMTKMPELVAFMHSMIGLAAVAIAIAVVAEPHAFGIAAPGEPLPVGNRLELFIGTFVGAITFSGSVIAFGKLSGKYKFRLFQGAPVVFGGQHLLNLLLALAMLACGLWFMATQSWTPFIIMTAIAFVLGVLIIIPIGGADMPVVVSMLNSYSGWAAAGIGFSLNNPM